ncbi:MAG: hypothetical protein M4D80_39785 [Myxococcota bacterium]|nr:hypothetical protein [Myxococcota bacterium]
MKFLVLSICVLAACGETSDPETGLCAGRPCRTSIASVAHWSSVSDVHAGNRCDFSEETKYIAPATAAAALQEVVFQDVKTHRFHHDFMTQVLPEFFGGLPAQMYQAIVQRRATRQYWAGAIFRLRDASGAMTGWGFDVIIDPTSYTERLTEAEIAAIEALLETRFHMPLVYAPTTRDAIDDALSFVSLKKHMPRACQTVSCTNTAKDCVVIPAAVTLCGHFMEGRSAAVEHARKARLAAVPGAYELPRAAGTHSVSPLFGTGELGPARIAITPMPGNATYEVTGAGDYVTRTYTQSFRVGAQSLELTWQIQIPEAGGGFQLAEPHIQGNMAAIAALDSSLSYDDLISFESCAATNLDQWRVTGALPDGEGFTIDFRHVVPGAGSGPLFVTRGEVKLAGQTRTVDDYFRLVYAGEHHNWNNQYWVLFDTPITYAGHPVHGLWLDEEAYHSSLEAAWTLDANRQPLERLVVPSYVVEQLP